MSRVIDLLLTILIACVALLLTLFVPDNSALRAVFGVPFVLFVPGYAITAAAFPNASLRELERLLLSLGLSLAAIIVGSLLLYWMPSGLNTYSWAALLFVITIVASLIALVHRIRHPGDHTSLPRFGFEWKQLLLLTLSVLLLIAALDLARTPLPSQGIEGYTELWMVPVSSDNPNIVRVGIASKELATTRYQIIVQAAGQNIREWSSIQVPPGQTWETTLALDPDSAGKMVQVLLYRGDTPNDVYRRVSFWPSQ